MNFKYFERPSRRSPNPIYHHPVHPFAGIRWLDAAAARAMADVASNPRPWCADEGHTPVPCVWSACCGVRCALCPPSPSGY